MQRRLRACGTFLVAFVVCMPTVVTPVPAQEAMAQFFPRYDWALEIDGKLSKGAMFYVEQKGRRILVLDPDLNEIALITQTAKVITALDPAKVLLAEEGQRVDLAVDAEQGRPKSNYTVDKDQVLFYLGNRRLKISPKKPLSGQATLDRILNHSPLYKEGMDGYTPDQESIDILKAQTSPVEIEMFFGTWCPHCKVVVPKFMKSMEVAANPILHVSYIGVPRGFSKFVPAASKGVRSIPTLIFYRNGKEFGRIPGASDQEAIEHAVAILLQANK